VCSIHRAKDYPEQRITLKDSSKVQLVARDLARVEGEIAAIQRSSVIGAMPTIPTRVHPAGDGSADRALRCAPILQRRSTFAACRLRHRRRSAGRPSRPMPTGIVLASDDYFFNGKTVFVDHGNGLISMYCHLERIDVQPGEAVSKGQRLGLVGMSGRATGPHLHWSVILNGAMVDPTVCPQAHAEPGLAPVAPIQPRAPPASERA
jgi:hypothetical protein